MPLSTATDRRRLHTRQITCTGFERADGLWEVEGHLTDVKAYGFETHDRGRIEPEEPLHEMWIRVTLDDDLTIRAVEAVTDHGPYTICPDITPNFQRLVGLQIRPGFTKAVKDRLGGVHGCTHLVDLMGPVATTAMQSILPVKANKERAARAARGEAEPAGDGRRPRLLNTCHAFASDGPVVRRQWPTFYTGPDAPDGAGASEAAAEGGAGKA